MQALIISDALDTNGQNARYARASSHWGDDPKVIKALAIGDYDPAGVIGRYQVAAMKFDELRIRSVHRSTHIYQEMPADILWTRNNRHLIMELAREADIWHFNNSLKAARKLRLRGKPSIVHHHGSLFRSNSQHQLDEARHFNAVQCVSTVDLLRVAPEILHWAPTAYDIDWLVEFGKKHRRQKAKRGTPTLRIVQAPTDDPIQQPYKSTSLLQAAVKKLQDEGMDIELVVIRNKPWIECMKIKATADIYFDQVKLGYGCNAVEAWGMGIPVIAGADDWTLEKMQEVYRSKTLPFYTAAESTIADAIVALADPATRVRYAKRGMAHVRKFHDERPALARLAELYRLAITQPIEDRWNPTIPPTTFRSSIPQVSVGSKRITFVNGLATVTNAHHANKLRALAVRYPKYGIEEVAG